MLNTECWILNVVDCLEGAEYPFGKIVAGATIEGLVPATDERMNPWKSIVALYFTVLVGQQPLP